MPRYLHAPKVLPHVQVQSRRSDLHVVILGLVWLTIASGAIVFSEPAPFDVLMLGLVVLLPIAGLAVFTPGMLLMMSAWLLIAATGVGAAALSLDVQKSTVHTLVTLYLSMAAFVLAGFIHKRPEAHLRLIMSAYMWSAAAASLLGIIGYFNLLPGTYDLFTSFGRARGAFKDPNVFGPYLVPPIVYGVHLWLSRPLTKAIVPLTLIVIMAFALFLSFSRGAWVNLAIALSAFGYLSFILARSNWARFKIAAVALASIAAMAMVAFVALQFESIANLADQRVSLDQTYDQGPEGRFGGQLKAIRLILDNPLGIGAGDFTQRHHHEEVHNIYLSMLLNNGWAGGILYALTVLITLLFGLRQLLRFTSVQPLLTVAWSCFLALVIEGFLIDTDHWRHFFILVGIVWGLGEIARVPQTVNAGHLPTRLRRVLATRPSRRPGAAVPLPNYAPAPSVARRERMQTFKPALRSTWPCDIKLAPLGKRVRPLPGSLRLN